MAGVAYCVRDVLLLTLVTSCALRQAPGSEIKATSANGNSFRRTRTNQMSPGVLTEKIRVVRFLETIPSTITHVDGGWSSWSRWSPCSESCVISGLQTTTRTCTNPAPSNGGKGCRGSSQQTRWCVIPHCLDVGSWSSWSQWSPCSESCVKGGFQTATRTCNSPACSGRSQKTRWCTIPRCPDVGSWSSWSQWSPCSESCVKGGFQTTTRTCNSLACSGSSHKTRWCTIPRCPATTTVMTTTTDATADGSWSSWDNWTACSKSCDTGSQTRSRTCAFPDHSLHGLYCPGSKADTRDCNTDHCPVEGKLSEWTTWTDCPVTCGNGTNTRGRSCDFPPGVRHGKDCIGELTQSKSCNDKLCPEWSPWLFTPCSVTCGTGSKQGMRRCSSGHEEDCLGPALSTETCTESACPVDGEWGDWQTWGTCSFTCGNGTRTRQRSCYHPAPAHGGKSCHGNATETGTCNVVDCPHWGDYQEVGRCSVTCGKGAVQLQRKCSTGNDRDCTGSPYDEKPCFLTPC